MEKSFGKELISRLLWGGCALVVLAVFIWLGPYAWFRPLFGIALALVALCALWEYYQLGNAKKMNLPAAFGLGCGLFYLVVHYLQTQDFMGTIPSPSIFALGISLFALFVYHCVQPKGAYASLASSFFGLVYTIIPLAWALDLLYLSDHGRFWLSFVILVTVLTDMGAYFTGKTMGRRRPWPKLSPKKTVEGSIGGTVFGIGGALLLILCWGEPISYGTGAILGLVLGVVGQIGDLSESLLKRDAKVKDSNSLPGLGGVLDVVDSLLFNIPVTLLALSFL